MQYILLLHTYWTVNEGVKGRITQGRQWRGGGGAIAPPPDFGRIEGAAQCFFGNFGSEIQIGNQRVWGKNWGLKVVINKFSMENLEKKDLNFKFKV